MAGKKTSVYILSETSRQLAATREATGRDLSTNAIVNESVDLYARVVRELKQNPACLVRYTPTGWVVEPAPVSVAPIIS